MSFPRDCNAKGGPRGNMRGGYGSSSDVRERILRQATEQDIPERFIVRRDGTRANMEVGRLVTPDDVATLWDEPDTRRCVWPECTEERMKGSRRDYCAHHHKIAHIKPEKKRRKAR